MFRGSLPVLAALGALLAAGGVATAEEGTELPERHAEWLEAVDPLILSAERAAFLELGTDYQRDAFIDRFWRVRDPYPQTARNELKVRYEERVQQVRSLYGGFADDRARIYLVHGEPAGRIEVRCTAAYTAAEIWIYHGSEQVHFSINLVFLVGRNDGEGVLWHPTQQGSELRISNLRNCRGGDQLELATAQARAEAVDWELGFQRMLAKPRPSSQEWLDTFQALSTELPEDAPTLEAHLDLVYPGRYRQRTVLQGMLAVPAAGVVVGDHLGFRSYNFELTGEVVLDDQLFENFRYKFAFPEQNFEEATIPLAFQRYLRPGEYTLVLRLQDTNGRSFFRRELPIEVPRLERVYDPPDELSSDAARRFEEASAAAARGETSIQIVPPRAMLQTGFVRFDTLAVGDEIARVAFLLDEQRLLTRTRPPWNVEIDLGEVPRPHTLRVEALDGDGGIVAYDEIRLNAGGRAFAVKLLEPRRGVRYERSLLARARVEIPEGRSLERIEFYLNDRLMATLYQPPFTQPIALPGGERLTYVRAVAYLPDGSSAEDLVFINAPDHLEEIDIQMVELYTTVLDRVGRPVQGLAVEDFAVFEDKVPQKILKFEAVGNQPINVGILFDNSASMRPVLDAARIAALTFFRDAVKPRDRAAIITFNRVPRLAVGLTNDRRLLGGGLAGLTAEGETALYDSIMFGLYYFAGVRGQRALLLLSDGKDEASRFTFRETLDYARRAGVTLYSIGLALSDPVFRQRLTQLSDETGGRAFLIDSLEELPPVYKLIQRELRSQYLLTYQSSNTADDEEFRAIRVELTRDDLTPRTLSGYYP